MQSIATNDIGLHPSIPDLETEKKANDQSGIHGDTVNMRQSVQNQAKKSLDANILSQLSPWVRFIAHSEGCGMGEELQVYEIISAGSSEMNVRLIYSCIGEDSLFDPLSRRKWTVDMPWLIENALVFPLQLWGSMTLLESIPKNGDGGHISTWNEQDRPVLYANARNYRHYHENDVYNLSRMFLDKTNHGELISELHGILSIQWCDYIRNFLWDGTPAPYPRIGTGYWFSNQYKYAQEEIIKRFLGQAVRVCYRKIIYNGESDDSIELESEMIGIIWGLSSARGTFGDIELIGENGDVDHIPKEAFLVGFTIGCQYD